MGSLANLTPLIEDIGSYVATELTMTLGSNLFIGEAPEGTNDCMMIFESAGPAPEMYIETETHLMDFWVRYSDSRQAYAMLERVYEVFQRNANYTLPNWYVYFSYASATIRDEDRDRDNNKLLALTITFIVRNLSHIS